MTPRVAVQIDADTRPMAAGMDRATAALRGFLSLGMLAAAARSASDFGSRITDLANHAQTSARWIQEWGYAAQMAGSSMEDVANAVLDLGRAQAQALGGSTGDRSAFADLGITMEELRTLRPDQLFERVAASLRNSEGATRQVNAALQVMGRGGRQLIGGLVDGMDEARANAERLGLVLEDDVVAAMDELGDRLDTIKLGFTALSAVVLKNMMSLNNWSHLAKLVGTIATSGGLATFMHAYLTGGISGVVTKAMEQASALNDIVDDYTQGEADAASATPRNRNRGGNSSATRGRGNRPETDALLRVGGFVGGLGSGNVGPNLLRVQTQALTQLTHIRYSIGALERRQSSMEVSL